MREDIFMWVLTGLGVAAFLYFLFKRIFTFPEEPEEPEEKGVKVKPPIPVTEKSAVKAGSIGDDIYMLTAFMSDAVRLFRSLTSYWPLFTAGVFIVAVGSAIPLLIYIRGDLHEFVSINVSHDVPSYGVFIVKRLKVALPGLAIVYRAVGAVGTYPLCLFVAFDLYLLKGHNDDAVRIAAGRYSKLIAFGFIPWAVSMIIPLSGDIVFSGVIQATVLGLAQYLLGAVAFALAGGYFFGYALAFLKGRDEPHTAALKIAFERFLPLYLFNIFMLLVTSLPTIVNGVLMTLSDIYNTEVFFEYIGWLYFISPIVVVALFIAPPLIVIERKGVKDAIIGGVRAIARNPVGYGVFILAVAAIGVAVSIVMGTLQDYILLPGAPTAYVISSYLLGTFVRLAASVFCLCMLAAYFMRHGLHGQGSSVLSIK